MKYVLYKRFSKVLDNQSAGIIERRLAHAGIEAEPEVWIGSMVLVVALFSVVGFLVPFSILPHLGVYSFDLVGLSGSEIVFITGVGLLFAGLFAVISIVLIYMHLYYLVHGRTSRVEEVLPDFLMMVAANLRSGMAPFAAFRLAARPEFGPLEKEIKIVAAKSLGTESLSTSLLQLTARIDSPLLGRTITFFEQGLRSGGKLAELLESAAEELREMEQLKKELALNTRSYTIFLFFVVIVGLPLLLAISGQFLTTFAKIQSSLDAGSITSATTALTAPKLTLSPNFVFQMAFVIIFGTCTLVSLLIGVISEGKFLYGVKYVLPLAIATSIIYLVIRALVSSFIGSIF
ncbi:MAG: type II secretion system F family protein [Candidatus Micrarchaeia archaeon]